ESRDRADFVLRHLPERFSVSPDARCEDHEILHRPTERDDNETPDHPGQKAELRRERWTNERSRARDRREMMTEDDPPVRRHVIASVIHPLGWRLSVRVERE